jgi:hypothetical protein
MARLGDLSSSVGRAGGRCWDRADRGLHSDAHVRPVACPALLGSLWQDKQDSVRLKTVEWERKQNFPEYIFDSTLSCSYDCVVKVQLHG